jgi:hypothetical protein
VFAVADRGCWVHLLTALIHLGTSVVDSVEAYLTVIDLRALLDSDVKWADKDVAFLQRRAGELPPGDEGERTRLRALEVDVVST